MHPHQPAGAPQLYYRLDDRRLPQQLAEALIALDATTWMVNRFRPLA